MLKKEENKKKKVLMIVGIIIFLIGIFLISFKAFSMLLIKNNERKALNEFYNEETKMNNNNVKDNQKLVKKILNNKMEYIAVIKISKINLEKGLVDKKSKYNSIDYGIQILNESDMPDVINGNVILAAHSGTSSISYFNDLDKLNIGDFIEINYRNKIFKYKLSKIYDVPKTGKISIDRDINQSSLTMITCRNNTNNQIVLIGELYI